MSSASRAFFVLDENQGRSVHKDRTFASERQDQHFVRDSHGVNPNKLDVQSAIASINGMSQTRPWYEFR